MPQLDFTMPRLFNTEGAAEKWFVKFCRDQGAFVQKMKMQFTVGWPDLLVVHGGETAFYEIKKKGKFPTALQWATLRALAFAGAKAYVLTIESPTRILIQHPFYPSDGRWVSAISPILSIDDRHGDPDRGQAIDPDTTLG